MKKRTLFAALSALALSMGVATAYADEATGTGTQTLCPSLHNYEIDPATAGSTYNWGIDSGTSGTDWELTGAPGTSVSVNWITPGSYPFWSQETSANGCIGPKTTITVTVSTPPEVADASNNICSATQATGSAVDVVNLELPQATNGVTVTKWVLKTLTIPAGITRTAGSASVGDELTDKDAIKSDAYNNANTTADDVVYTFTPYAGECPGQDFTITITVYPEVKAPTIKF